MKTLYRILAFTVLLVAMTTGCSVPADSVNKGKTTAAYEKGWENIPEADPVPMKKTEDLQNTPLEQELSLEEPVQASEDAGTENTEAEQEKVSDAGQETKKIIVLDPGHTSMISNETEPLGPGSAERKAKDAIGTHGTASGLMEYELTLTVSERLKDELEERGYEVILTRTDSNRMLSCAERAEIANQANADVFLRIHADGSEDSSANGAMTICITPKNPYISEEYQKSRLLSDDVLNAFVSATGCKKRSVWETDSMSGNNWSKVPTTLLEMGFMTNPKEDQLMASEDYQQKMIQGIADGIDQYFEDLKTQEEANKTQ